MADKGEFFALKVKGDSMSPTIIDGSVVIVRKQNSVENKEIAVVQINGDEEATIKRIQKQEHGLALIGDNALVYPPHYYSEEQVRSLPVRILGKVVKARKMLWEFIVKIAPIPGAPHKKNVARLGEAMSGNAFFYSLYSKPEL